ncbi:hypothetical protein X975_22419, partial [Stegodyphus mimosarum]
LVFRILLALTVFYCYSPNPQIINAARVVVCTACYSLQIIAIIFIQSVLPRAMIICFKFLKYSNRLNTTIKLPQIFK